MVQSHSGIVESGAVGAACPARICASGIVEQQPSKSAWFRPTRAGSTAAGSRAECEISHTRRELVGKINAEGTANIYYRSP